MPLALSHNLRSSSPDEVVEQPAPRTSPHLIRVLEAARVTGLPPSLIRKSFMREDRRPNNVPPPPPHRRIGRAIYILAAELPAWVRSLGSPPSTPPPATTPNPPRPTLTSRSP